MSKKRKLKKNIYRDQYDNRNKGGAGGKGFIDWKKIEADNLKFYKAEEGSNKLNIIPFEVKSKLNPAVHRGVVDVGDLDFVLDVWVHRRLGPTEANVICLKSNYNKPCPACEKNNELYEAGKKEEAKDFRATRRVLYNVQPIRKGKTCDLEIFDVSHFLFAKELIEEAHDCGDGKDIISYADIEEGCIIKFRMALTKLGKNDMAEYKSFKFLEREEELDDELIDQAISFDQGLVVLSYEEIEKIMYSQDEEDEEGEEDEEDEEEKDEEEEDEEEEEERPGKKKATSKNKCPAGHKFGDADKHKECTKCKIWEECDDFKN